MAWFATSARVPLVAHEQSGVFDEHRVECAVQKRLRDDLGSGEPQRRDERAVLAAAR